MQPACRKYGKRRFARPALLRGEGNKNWLFIHTMND
jgi:hypothetical protein